jgi:hypothetical protein
MYTLSRVKLLDKPSWIKTVETKYLPFAWQTIRVQLLIMRMVNNLKFLQVFSAVKPTRAIILPEYRGNRKRHACWEAEFKHNYPNLARVIGSFRPKKN